VIAIDTVINLLVMVGLLIMIYNDITKVEHQNSIQYLLLMKELVRHETKLLCTTKS
jgi:hypothetical protein